MRSFFRKAVALRDKPVRVKGTRRVSLKGEICWTKRSRPLGKVPEFRYMALSEARKQVGRSKGGKAGGGHKWSSEEARKAGLKSWKKKGRRGPYTGVRIGRKLAIAPRVSRQPFRELHADRWFRDYMYLTQAKSWFRWGVLKSVSEKTALRNLGYLPKPGGYVPEEVHPVKNFKSRT